MNDSPIHPQKQCAHPQCQQWFPATSEYFHKNGKQGLLHPYCKKCRNRISECYRQEHLEEESARKSEYYKKNREVIHANVTRYRVTHREQVRAWGRVREQRRIAYKRNLPGTLTDQQVQVKLKTQHYACYYCFRPFKQRKDKAYVFQLDHTIPVSRPEFAPRHDVNYIVLACPHCNQSKSNKMPHEWPEGGRLF